MQVNILHLDRSKAELATVINMNLPWKLTEITNKGILVLSLRSLEITLKVKITMEGFLRLVTSL